MAEASGSDARRKVVVTGIGVVSPIGIGRAEVLDSLRAGRSGIALWRSSIEGRKSYPAGIVQGQFADRFTRLEAPALDRCAQMGLVAAAEAFADAGLSDLREYGERAGAYYSTVRGGADTEQSVYRQILVEGKNSARPFDVFAVMHNSGSAQISIRHGILGPVITHTEACASSAIAIGDAYRAIATGALDVAIAGGAEAPLSDAVFGVWNAMRVLAPPDEKDVSRSCRPFDVSRAGIVLGEGAVFFILESEANAKRRGRPSYAELVGFGIASDAFHIGAPDVGGEARAIRAALRDSGLAPGDIDYYNAHATGTRGGDVVETKALMEAFGEAGGRVPVSATKSVHGHMLGATSAMELLITMFGMVESFVPATANLEDVDPQCPLNHVAIHPRENYPIEHALAFSAGFGGTNAAIVIRRAGEVRGIAR